MKGEPLRIFVEPDVKPHVVHTPFPIPAHFRKEVKENLDRDVRLGVKESSPKSGGGNFQNFGGARSPVSASRHNF